MTKKVSQFAKPYRFSTTFSACDLLNQFCDKNCKFYKKKSLPRVEIALIENIKQIIQQVYQHVVFQYQTNFSTSLLLKKYTVALAT